MISFVLLVLGMVVFNTQPTHAAPASTTPQCMVHNVFLHRGKSATTRCAKWSTSGHQVSPYSISWDHCTAGNAKLEIQSASTGIYCFYGDGYLGLGDSGGPGDIYWVTTVYSLQYVDGFGQYVCGSGWLRWYYNGNPNGNTFYFGNCETYNSSNSVFGTYGNNIKVTQVDLNS
ncbi:MAG TPA: hypothetical protein VKQ30_11680 [Ktedonobacterales bacterium]|nr:hypothetical protein [Ktedonobacterales bacterium]